MEFLEEVVTSSDDEIEEDIYVFIRRRPRIFKERVNFFDNFDDIDFQTRFRLSKVCVRDLLNQIEGVLSHATERYFILVD